MQNVFDKLEEKGITIYNYEEKGKLCGYELNTYTEAGVNQIIFIDFRDTDKSPNSPEDFKELFLKRIESIDVDEEVEIHRQDPLFRQDFTLTKALKDFKDWKKNLLKLFKSL